MNARLTFILALGIGICAAQDGPAEISDADKAKLIDSLKIVSDANSVEKKKLIAAGIAVLTPAAQDPNAAMALFERCYKKVEYDDNPAMKEKDWREWKTANRENLASSANKRALMYQARWTLVTLQAASVQKEDYDPSLYVPQAAELITAIVTDRPALTEAAAPFNTSMLTGPVGRLYRFDGYKPDGWPDDIMRLPQVVDALLLKDARDKGDVVALRKGWNVLIPLTRKVLEEMKIAAQKQAKEAARSAPGGRNRIAGFLDRITKEDTDSMLLMLEWAREAECFRLGDELASSGNMLKIIAKCKPEQQEMLIGMMKMLMEMKDREDDDFGPRGGPGRPGVPGRPGPGGGGPGGPPGPQA